MKFQKKKYITILLTDSCPFEKISVLESEGGKSRRQIPQNPHENPPKTPGKGKNMCTAQMKKLGVFWLSFSEFQRQ
jgi:hypothetical protein